MPPPASTVVADASVGQDETRLSADWVRAVDGFSRALTESGYSPYTLRDYRTDVARLALCVNVEPSELSEEHLGQMDGCLVTEGISEQGRRRRISAYRKFMEWRDERLVRDPVAPEIYRLCEAEDWADRVVVGFLYLTGLRLVEIAGLEGRDVRRRKGLVTTRRGARHVPLHPELVELVNELRVSGVLAPYAPLIPGPRGFPVTARTLHSRFHRLMKRIGHDRVKPGDLRRDGAHGLARMHTPEGLLKAFLCKDRGRITAPRKGRFVDLECLRDRIARLPL